MIARKTQMKTALETQNLSVGYTTGRKTVNSLAADLNLHLFSGELVCLLGPNGAGKSTLLRTLAGMQPPLNGTVLIDGRELHTLSALELARYLSIVLTERPDAGLLNGYGLVALGRYPYTNWTGHLTAHDEAVIHWAVRATGARDFAEHPLSELSDGQRQKLMIARALAQQPTVMLLDEPTAFLDLPRRVEVMQLLKQLSHNEACAILLSTHDLDLALRTADRIWLLANDGTMHIGTPEDLVLNGAIETAFRSEGITFDRTSGAFKFNQPTSGAVHLTGSGVNRLWTARALERAGFAIDDSAALQIHVSDEHPPAWHMNHQQYTRLEDLLQALK